MDQNPSQPAHSFLSITAAEVLGRTPAFRFQCGHCLAVSPCKQHFSSLILTFLICKTSQDYPEESYRWQIKPSHVPCRLRSFSAARSLLGASEDPRVGYTKPQPSCAHLPTSFVPHRSLQVLIHSTDLLLLTSSEFPEIWHVSLIPLSLYTFFSLYLGSFPLSCLTDEFLHTLQKPQPTTSPEPPC